MEIILGFVIVIISGMLTGTFMWPMKKISKLQFEHYWFLGSFFGLFLLPWLMVLVFVPRPFTAYAQVGEALLIGNLLSLGWGIANVLYGLCIVKIGAALAGAILTSFGLSVGVLMPLIFKGSGLFENAPDIFSRPGYFILAGVLVILVGVFTLAKAGFAREKSLQLSQPAIKLQGTFLSGLVMAIIAGILSSCISLSFVYSQAPVIAALKAQGASEFIANIGVWAGALFAGIVVNIIYPAVIMTRKRNWLHLFSSRHDFLLAPIIGAQLILGAVLLGKGMIILGALGASVGFGIMQAMQIIGNQTVGFASGEWRGVDIKARNLMYLALFIIMIAIIIFSYANTLM